MVEIKKNKRLEAEVEDQIILSSEISENELKKGQRGVFSKPPQQLELLTAFIPEVVTDKTIIKEKREKIISEMNRNEYILLEDWQDIIKIYGTDYSGSMNAFLDGRKLFFCWKYSGMLNAIESEEDKQIELCEKIRKTPNLEDYLLNLAREKKLFSSAYFIDNSGRKQLSSATGTLKRRKKDGSLVYVKDEANDVTYPSTRNCILDDLSYNAVVKLIYISPESNVTKNQKIELLSEQLYNELNGEDHLTSGSIALQQEVIRVKRNI